jgi:hypothetical protein
METSASFEARYAPLLYPTNQVDFLEQSLVDRLGRKEPEFGSYAGQLGTGHGVQ